MNELRNIEKIARNLKYYENKVGNNSLSSNSYEVMRLIVKHPGITSAYLSYRLNIDKGLISRIVKNLQQTKYIITKEGEKDKREKLLFPTSLAEAEKYNNELQENQFFSYLEQFINEEEKENFYKILDKIYVESKRLRKTNFLDIEYDK